MKKTVIALFAALALLLGSGALMNGASAAPYPNTVKTKSSVKAPSSVKVGKAIKVTINVKAGNAKVKDGTVKIEFNGKTYKATVKNGVVKISLKGVKRAGKYKIEVSYKPSGSSVYKASSASTKVTVKKKK